MNFDRRYIKNTLCISGFKSLCIQVDQVDQYISMLAIHHRIHIFK